MTYANTIYVIPMIIKGLEHSCRCIQLNLSTFFSWVEIE